jgi:D-glycero-D-manno-heptose 1,7-bisphosphate phosphatase
MIAPTMTTLRPAIFLDRDGVVIEESHFLGDVSRVRLVQGAGEAIAALNRAGWVVVIVTNQSGVARGLFTVESVGEVHSHLSELLRGFGARIDAYRFCPHHPEAELTEYRVDCECRKPKAGMLLSAGRELCVDPARSWMIGDRVTDLEAGASAGCRTVLVRTGHGSQVEADNLDRAALRLELIAPDLADAVERLGLAQSQSAA